MDDQKIKTHVGSPLVLSAVLIADGSGRRRRRARVHSFLAIDVVIELDDVAVELDDITVESPSTIVESPITVVRPSPIAELNPEVIPPVPAAVGSEGVAGSRGTTIPSPMLTHAATQDTTAACTCRSARLPVMICRRGEEAGRAGMRGAGVATSID